MDATARCADYQRRVAGAATNLLRILAALVHVSNSETAEGWDNPDVGVAMLSRKAPDRLGSGWPFPAMKPRNGTTRRLAVVARAWNHRQSAFGEIGRRFSKWPCCENCRDAHVRSAISRGS